MNATAAQRPQPLAVLDEEFFDARWRREPVVLRGAAGMFLAPAPGREEVRALATATTGVRTDGRSIWFLEALREGLPGVAALCAAAREKFDWDDVWCDVFLTEGSSSIGSHIDNSDNFTIQLEGEKRWRLASPATLDPEQRRLRMLGEPGVGDAPMPQDGPSRDTLEFTLGPGDVLYIPLLWRHWGVSAGDSLSASLVVNARTVWQALHRTLSAELRHEEPWHRPLPVGPGTAELRKARLTEAVTALGSSGALERTRRKAEREVAMRAARGPVDRLDIDMTTVKRFIASAPEPPVDGFVLPGGPPDSAAPLNALLARKNLRDLLKLMLRRFTLAAGETERELYQACARALTASSGTAPEALLAGPDITSWIAVAKQGPSDLPVARQEDPLAHRLAFFLLPELAAVAGAVPVPEIRVLADRDGGLAVPRLGRAVTARSATGTWSLSVAADGAVIARDGGGTTVALSEDGPGTGALGRVLDGPWIVPAPSHWLDEHLPPTEVLPSVEPVDVARFHDEFTEAAELLRAVWPEAWEETRSCVERLLPMPWAGLRPHNYSIHAFRGQIVSSPRPALMAAQTLVHETGHNRMSTLIDLMPLCSNPEDRAVSPVVNADRPLTAVFHGCYSFAREIHLTSLLIDKGVPEVPTTDIRGYLAHRTEIVRAAWALLHERARLEPVGAAILAEVERILDRLA
ncbi:aKG-HExxH-type peptide beta-hydroxylase [Streptomyces sp. enrichment culture]|uniref:aKG-HExxH-type peptide beta-hydroxylase n=1 Tax=Streptomyces sp. enrichment culture TaxID=1795815 RepID=UPI003F54C1FE